MKKRKLGNTNIYCPEIAFGAAPIGNLFKNLEDIEVLKILKETQKHNINFYDTSPFYGYGLSEKRLGDFFQSLNRKDFIISTKVGRYLVPEDPKKIDRGIFKRTLDCKPIFDYSYDGVMRSFEQSLKRLKVDYIDICLIHDVDYFTHKNNTSYFFNQAIREGYKAIQKLKEEKLIRATGLGLNDADIANKFLLAENFDCVLLAGRYTLLDQSANDHFFETAENQNTGILIGGVFNSGILAKGLKNSTFFYQSIPNKVKEKYKEINKICLSYKLPVPAAAIQYCLKNSIITSIILGMDDINHINQNIKLSKIKIHNKFWEEIAKII